MSNILTSGLIVCSWAISIPIRLLLALRILLIWKYPILISFLILTSIHSFLSLLSVSPRTPSLWWTFLYFSLAIEGWWGMARHFKRADTLAITLLPLFVILSGGAIIGAVTPSLPFILRDHYALWCGIFLLLSFTSFLLLSHSSRSTLRENTWNHVLGLCFLFVGQWGGMELHRQWGGPAGSWWGNLLSNAILQGTSMVAYWLWWRMTPSGEEWEEPPAGRWWETRSGVERVEERLEGELQ